MRPVDNIRQMWDAASLATVAVAKKGCTLAHCFCEKVKKEADKLFNAILPPQRQERIKGHIRVLRTQIEEGVTNFAQSTQKNIAASLKSVSSRLNQLGSEVRHALSRINEKVQKTFTQFLDAMIPSRVEARIRRNQVMKLMVQVADTQNLAKGLSLDGAVQKERADRIEAEARRTLEENRKSASEAEESLHARVERAEDEARKALGLARASQADAEAVKARAEKAEAEASAISAVAKKAEQELELAHGQIVDLTRQKEVVAPAPRDPSPMPPAFENRDDLDILSPPADDFQEQAPQQAAAEEGDVRPAAPAKAKRKRKTHAFPSGPKTPSLKVCLQGTGYHGRK